MTWLWRFVRVGWRYSSERRENIRCDFAYLCYRCAVERSGKMGKAFLRETSEEFRR